MDEGYVFVVIAVMAGSCNEISNCLFLLFSLRPICLKRDSNAVCAE